MSTIAERIVEYLAAVDRPCSAKEIASEIKANPNTVRPTLTRMVREGKVFRVFRGHYCTNFRYGVRRPPRVQNLFVVADVGDVSQSENVRREYDYWVGGNREVFGVGINFGVERDKISWWVKAPLGLDLYGLVLCRWYVEEVCRDRGYSGLNWMVANVEVLRDYEDVRLEGCKIVTFEDLTGVMEKIYQKQYGLRREVKLSRSISFEDLLTLVWGGLPQFQISQRLGELNELVKVNREILKRINKSNFEIIRTQNMIVNAFFRLIDKN